MEVWKHEFDELSDMLLELENELDTLVVSMATRREVTTEPLLDGVRLRERFEEIEQKRIEILRKMFPDRE